MTQIKQVTENFTVSPQLTISDLDKLKSQGVCTIIMNRPDGEEEGQIDGDLLRSAAREAGLDWVDIPVVPGAFTPDAIEAMAAALRGAQGPVHAFCKSGTRACFLWGMAMALDGEKPVDAILAAAADAGYDMQPAAPMLERLAAADS